MASHIDETKLLDLIEGELDGASAAILRGQLADDPHTLARLARLESDRLELRALPEPELPHDFRAQLETLLARPMLIDTERPGAYRRQQRRLNRQKRLKRLAVAASIALVSAAAMWMAATAFVPQITGAIGRALLVQRVGSDDPVTHDSLASRSDSQAGQPIPVSTISASELTAITKSHDVVHHYSPQPVSTREFVTDQPGATRKVESAIQASIIVRSALAAPFAIYVQSRDIAMVEQTMIMVVRDSGHESGLVRNFSYAEARRIEDEWRIANAGKRSDSERMVAEAGRAAGSAAATPMMTLADRVRERLSQRDSSNAGEARTSGLIIGQPQQVPTLEQQLEFSSRGATHTVMVPAPELATMLSRLGQSSGQETWLRMSHLESSAHAPNDAMPTVPSIDEWMQQMPQVRAAADRLMRDNADAVVMIPVVVISQK